LRGRAHPSVWLDWESLQQGGRLHVELTGTPPQQGWGTRPDDLPASPCAADAATPPAVGR
jgi:putative alpha-1,2-mannosidase